MMRNVSDVAERRQGTSPPPRRSFFGLLAHIPRLLPSDLWPEKKEVEFSRKKNEEVSPHSWLTPTGRESWWIMTSLWVCVFVLSCPEMMNLLLFSLPRVSFQIRVERNPLHISFILLFVLVCPNANQHQILLLAWVGSSSSGVRSLWTPAGLAWPGLWLQPRKNQGPFYTALINGRSRVHTNPIKNQFEETVRQSGARRVVKAFDTNILSFHLPLLVVLIVQHV